jgi:hypothetical protein
MADPVEQLGHSEPMRTFHELDEMAKTYGGDVRTLLQTGSFNETPFSNSLLQIDGYAAAINQAVQYTPEYAILHFPHVMETPAGIDLGFGDEVVTFTFGNQDIMTQENDAALGKRMTVLPFLNAYIRSTFYVDVMNAKVNPHSNARHTLQEGEYYTSTAMRALEQGIPPSKFIAEACDQLGIPLSVTIGLRSTNEDEVLASIYYPLVSSPALALEGLQRAIASSTDKEAIREMAKLFMSAPETGATSESGPVVKSGLAVFKQRLKNIFTIRRSKR